MKDNRFFIKDHIGVDAEQKLWTALTNKTGCINIAHYL
jgi:hypothetical protein